MAEIDQSIAVREEILTSIRAHLAASAPFDALVPAHAPHESRRPDERLEQPIPLTECLQEAIEAVSGNCTVVQTHQEAARVLGRIIDRTKARQIAISDAPLVKAIVAQLTTDAVINQDVRPPELFDYDLGITGAQWAIAETGTLVLQSQSEHHRLASLVPPVHVAIVIADRIRRTMAEVLELIHPANGELSRAVTFITGPSRTSDIELTLAIGVHGPGELHVIVIDEKGPVRS